MKRPWLMAAWPLLLLFYSSSTLTKVVHCSKSKNNDARLKVSIRKDTMLGVPSCQHTFSQIELLNLHTTEPIMIHSIQTIPEETVLVRPDSTSPTSSPSLSSEQQEPRQSTRELEYGRSWGSSEIPQQLHVSKLPSGSLSLGPGQVAIVPVTFLPRYPSPNSDCEENRERGASSTDDDDDSDMDDYYSTTVADGRSPPPLGSTAKLDLVDLVGEKVLRVIDNKRQYLRHTLDPTYRRRNNIHSSSLPKGDELYEVSTTVVVDTSRGVVKLPISASSIRDNMYKIPDVITFYHPSLTIDDDEKDSTGEEDDEFDDYDAAMTTTTTKTRQSKSKSSSGSGSMASMDGVVLLDTLHAVDSTDDLEDDERDNPASLLDTIKSEKECFDLYLSNPFPDRELQIMEALISRPEFVSVQFDPSMMAPDLTMLVGSGPSQVLRQWTVDGPLYLSPGGVNQYVLTLCTALSGEIEPDEGSETYLDEMSKWIDAGDPKRNLGFLQIRTDAETLFIGLEHTDAAPVLSLTKMPYLSGGYQTSSGSSNEANSLTPSPNSNNTKEHKNSGTSTLLKSSPERLDFDFISTTSPSLLITFALQNKSPVPIRIMRVTVGIDSSGDEENAKEAKLIGLELKMNVKREKQEFDHENKDARHDGDYGDDENAKAKLGSLVLAAATTHDNILELACSLNPDRYFSDSNKESFRFSGHVVVRGTMDTELSYNQWREETLQNPYRDEHLTLEIPFTISVLNGRVEALIERSSHPYPQLFAAQSWDGSGRAVSHLFFPMSQYTAVQGTEDVLPQQTYIGANEIRHDLRILSNMVYPLDLSGAEIVDDDDEGETQSLCNRFNVSVVPPSDSDDLYLGFEEIGYLVLKYKFSMKGKKTERQHELLPHGVDPHIPKKCSLIIKTNLEEVGTFRIPLLIFPGRLEVSSKESSSTEPSMQNEILLGFGKLLSWCRSSRLGKAFVDTLLESSEDRRKPRSDSYILSKYISENSGWDPRSKPRFLPILLKIGAIDTGKIAKTHIYLTNHNPIPLTVSIDVGEIEGLSISLSRDESQVTGDGNSLLDYLPKRSNGSLVKLGRNKEHPVDGLIDFLASNDQAIELLSKFKFRDSISPHGQAIETTDVLQLLHDWHSKSSFHKEAVSKRFGSNGKTKCKKNVHPPEYKVINETTKTDGFRGAFVVSSEKQLSRHLTECWRRDPNEMSSDKNTIKIPPGATARFEVQVRAPSKEFLNEDISHLLMSGLVLSTNLGDVMPIFVAVEALQGQLHASHVDSTQSNGGNRESGIASMQNENRKIMNVPLDLSWYRDPDGKKRTGGTAITIPATNWTALTTSMANSSYSLGKENLGNGVPLFLRSSFSRSIRVISVESCNPWFRFVPLQSTRGVEHSSDGGVLVGLIRTDVDCSSAHSSDGGFPSFYQCMLNWLSNRSTLQPEGCGKKDFNLKLRQIDSVKRTIELGLRRLKKSKKTSDLLDPISKDFGLSPWNETDLSHIKTGRRKNDGILNDLPFYEAIWNAFKIANKFGYDLLSSSLRATVEYDSKTLDDIEHDSHDEMAKQNFSLSITGLDVQSILKPPKLFDGDYDYLEFKPTAVGSVESAFLSLQNPTGVPVRVRIGTAATKRFNIKDGRLARSRKYAISEEVNYSPYVQNGKSSVPTNETTSFSWWDGYGAFFVPNEHGDVVRSHNNISVTGAGVSASISLVNPSLNAQIGFLVGCGKRCGLRDKNHPNISPANPISSSPIGASAAAGVTLKGNFRHDSPEANDKSTVEPIMYAGGTPVATTDGPAAFAIPFSALDEIIIPPFGRGSLGPIYFRPPGRHKIIGCEVAKQSGAKLDEMRHNLCSSQRFDSLLYLENSLTGIEKIGLRGKSTWENLVFVDPQPREGEDSFGDIEFRNGMPTLIFPGTSNTVSDPNASIFGKRTQHLSVVKEVVLQNAGDGDSNIAAVSLRGMNGEIEEGGSCSFGSFRLLNCWESIASTKNAHASDGVNIHTGFVLKAGENRSLFVEHIPDCRTNKEFVTVNVRLDNMSKRTPGMRHSRSRGLSNPFAKQEFSMFFGYQMNGVAYSRCAPVDTRLSRSTVHTDSISMNEANYSSRIEVKTFGSDGEESPLLISQVILFSIAALMLCYALRARFHAIAGMLQKIHGEPTKNLRNWNAAFRCLARSHPTSTELQTMSREQMRQDVIGRYKAKGNTASSSLNSTNGFSRDRRSAVANTVRHRIGKEGSSGNERTRPFSDALFHDTSIADHSSLRRSVPIGLGWRTAYSRGIIKDNSLLPTAFASRTKNLLRKRTSAAMSESNGEKLEDKGNVKKRDSARTNQVYEIKHDPSSSTSSASISSEDSVSAFSEEGVSKNEDAEFQNITSGLKYEEPFTRKVKTGHVNGSERRSKGSVTRPVSENVTVTKKVGSATPYPQREIQNKIAPKMDKKPKKKVEAPTQSSKTANGAGASKRTQKPKIQVPKARECDELSKPDKVPKSAPWGQTEKPKAPAKSQAALLGPLPKSSAPSTAWRGERQKVDTSGRTEKEVLATERKSKLKEKQKKKPSKQMLHEKKEERISTSRNEVVPDIPVVSAGLTNQPQVVLTPPPGFGSAPVNVPVSPTSRTQFPAVSSTDSQLSLEQMLHSTLTGGSNDTDFSLSAPSHVSPTAMPFPRTNTGGGDLLFTSNLPEPNPSPTLRGFQVSEGFAAENPSSHRPQIEEPWLPSLLIEEPEPIEQPWLPTLLNEETDNGFDVMDFLDGILQDGSPAEDEPALFETELSAPNTPGRIGAGGAGNSATTPVSQNPWAMESRAAAYGISFDDEEGNRSSSATISGGLGGNLPLLTPAAILSAEENNNGAGEEDEKAISFYAGLLDE